MAPVRAADRDTDDLQAFIAAAKVAVAEGAPVTIAAGDHETVCPPADVDALLGLLGVIADGRRYEFTALPDELSTGQAADLLGVSRPTVVALVDSGALPATRVGTHRRLATADVLAYRSRRQVTRGEALDALAVASEELGLYDA